MINPGFIDHLLINVTLKHFYQTVCADWHRCYQVTKPGPSVAVVTCSGCCIGQHQNMHGSVWILAAAAQRPRGTTGTEGYRWHPRQRLNVRGQGIMWEWWRVNLSVDRKWDLSLHFQNTYKFCMFLWESALCTVGASCFWLNCQIMSCFISISSAGFILWHISHCLNIKSSSHRREELQCAQWPLFTFEKAVGSATVISSGPRRIESSDWTTSPALAQRGWSCGSHVCSVCSLDKETEW